MHQKSAGKIFQLINFIMIFNRGMWGGGGGEGEIIVQQNCQFALYLLFLLSAPCMYSVFILSTYYVTYTLFLPVPSDSSSFINVLYRLKHQLCIISTSGKRPLNPSLLQNTTERHRRRSSGNRTALIFSLNAWAVRRVGYA